MKVTRAKAAENRNRVLDVAGRLFRERGFDGIGIADLMKEAGLTHGGFYGNFESKEDLIVQVFDRVFGEWLRRWKGSPTQSEGSPFDRFVGTYLSKDHCRDRGTGCALAALASDAARHGGAVRSTFGTGIKSVIEMLSQMAPERSAEAKRKKAISAFSEMVGAVILARASDDAALAREILDTSESNLAPSRQHRRSSRRSVGNRARRRAA